MKRFFSIVVLCSAIFFSVAFVSEGRAQGSSSFNSFWAKFKTAVTKEDKQTLSSMVKYPLSMPYGVRSVKNKTDFVKRYREIFYKQLEGFPVNSAKKCFANATPEKDENAYIIACNDVVIFRFVSTAGTWKLSGVDNINE